MLAYVQQGDRRLPVTGGNANGDFAAGSSPGRERTQAQAIHSRFISIAALLCTSLFLSSCARTQWAQYRHDPAGTAFVAVHSQAAVRELWSAPLGLAIEFGAEPVIGADGTIYVVGNSPGSIGATMVAVSSSGQVKWRVNLRADSASGSAVVDSAGNAYALTTDTATVDDTRVPTNGVLHIVSRFLNDRTRALPNRGWSAASPKVIDAVPAQIFVSAVSGSGEEIEVFDSQGNLTSRRTLCGPIVVGGGGDAGSIVNLPVAIWQEPEDGGRTFVAAMVTCEVFVMTWTNNQLQPVWEDDFNDNDFSEHAAPAIFNGLLIVGRKGHLVEYDVRNGRKDWEYDSNDRLLFPPASIGIQLYAAGTESLHVLDFNGNLIFKHAIDGGLVGASALTIDCAYIGSYDGGLNSICLDLPQSQIVRDASPVGGFGGTSIDTDGNVYYVDSGGTLHAWTTQSGR
jgi:PQQ-like domain